MRKREIGFITLILLSLVQTGCHQNKENTSARTEDVQDMDASGDSLIEKQEDVLSPSAQLYKEVMAVHDSVMPRTGKVMALQNQLMDKVKAGGLNAEQVGKANMTVEQLEQAYKGMMDWMKNFDYKREERSEEQKMEYLEQEMQVITSVKEKILLSIDESTALLEEFEE